MKSMLVIGLGRFGNHLSCRLAELGNEVMAVDRDEKLVNQLAEIVTSAQIGDCMDERVLKALGVGNFDVCFVCIGSNFQASLEITSLLKENGAKHVVSKADRDIHAKFLLRNGADEVLYPERDVARRAAVKYSANNVSDFIELTPEFSIIEITPPKEWLGKTIGEINVRARYNLNILAIKRQGRAQALFGADYVFCENETLLVAGSEDELKKLAFAKR